MLVVINPFDFPVRVIVNGQVLGRLTAFDRMRIPDVVAGSVFVTLKNRRQVVASDTVFVQANSRTRWSPRTRGFGHHGFGHHGNRFAAWW